MVKFVEIVAETPKELRLFENNRVETHFSVYFRTQPDFKWSLKYNVRCLRRSL